MKRTILSLAAHNDDHLIGAGGALVKYAREGKRVRTVVFSYGEKSHPYLRKAVIRKRRVGESLQADKIMGGAGVVYLGLREGNLVEDFKKKNIAKKLAQIIKKEKPVKIFTHGIDDVHPDHRAVYRLVMELIETKVITCPVYSFEIWSLMKLRQRNLPRLVVDTSKTFTTKMRAFLVHKSQLQAWMLGMWMLLWKLIVKDWLSGLLHGYTYAEVFYRLK